MALAAGVHDGFIENGHPEQLVSNPVAQPHSTDHQADGDHCCHGIAHLLGLSGQKPIIAINSAADYDCRRPSCAKSLSPRPDLRPPRNA